MTGCLSLLKHTCGLADSCWQKSFPQAIISIPFVMSCPILSIFYSNYHIIATNVAQANMWERDGCTFNSIEKHDNHARLYMRFCSSTSHNQVAPAGSGIWRQGGHKPLKNWKESLLPFGCMWRLQTKLAKPPMRCSPNFCSIAFVTSRCPSQFSAPNVTQ